MPVAKGYKQSIEHIRKRFKSRSENIINNRNGLKYCNKCGQTKHVEEFGFRSGRFSHLYRSYCKKCETRICSKYVSRHRDKQKEYNRKQLMRRRGFTIEQYNKALFEQKGKCAICGLEWEGYKNRKNLYIDHCHETGYFRGLLCDTCNRAIGLLHDNPIILIAAAEYISGKWTCKSEGWKVGMAPKCYKRIGHTSYR